ncbi:hypothetical protein BDV24DRAFT_166769 [Aspergillus arachidicola]|uniref:Uncharacterized protein n=1 Tax=Aspergillus arachidicola TaxID=656916 RepID=A0A5N6XZA5_9EURO|nr:hypothetical protein BDV24DRAFT_166769 [Aspergillus arachidicola]
MRYSFFATPLISAALALPAIPANGVTPAQELQDVSFSQSAFDVDHLHSNVKRAVNMSPSHPPSNTEPHPLPFLPPPSVPCKASKPTDSELCLGIEKYCKDIDQNLPFFGEVDGAYKKKNGRSYKARGECRSAREPQPSTTKPGETVPTLGVSQTAGQQWKEPDPSKCRDSKSGTEDCLGTPRYCAPCARAVKDEAKLAEVQKDCEASRGRHPSAAQPPQRPVSPYSPSSEKISDFNMQTSNNVNLGNGQAKPDLDAYDRIPI